eukprot:354857-Chlamydomonas_euryale.AAC.44
MVLFQVPGFNANACVNAPGSRRLRSSMLSCHPRPDGCAELHLRTLCTTNAGVIPDGSGCGLQSASLIRGVGAIRRAVARQRFDSSSPA